jgi:hypothetical protein
MVSEAKAIKIINKYLQCAQESNIRQYFPVVASQIYSDDQLCERIIDYLGDIYIYAGLDANYEENACGLEIQEAINFLAFCNRKV